MSQGGVIEITPKGRELLEKATQLGAIYSNEVHLLSGLAKSKHGMQYPSFFEQFEYHNPPLGRCREYLRKNGYTTEHN